MADMEAVAGVVLVLFAVTSSGCTLIGAGIGGAASPGWHERLVAGDEASQIDVGADVEVRLRSGELVRGTYAGTWRDLQGAPMPGVISLHRAGQRRDVRTDDIHHVKVLGRSNGALTGALIGFGVDVLVLSFAVLAAKDKYDFKMSDQGGQY